MDDDIIDKNDFSDQRLEPSQTGDFPSQQELKEFGRELKEMELKGVEVKVNGMDDQEEIKMPDRPSSEMNK